ncbi:MAG: sucrase ferredoxin [Actinomycetota bacterium]
MPALDDRCSLRSLAAGEPLAGTASTIRHWLLIEHPGPWGRDGLLDARLPAGLGRELRDLERRTGARVLLIRKPDRFPEYGDNTLICFAVDTREAWLRSAVLDRIEDAVHLDPRERASFAGGLAEAPLFVVCTHGRRDPCCAERGRPLAGAAAAADREVIWESTHVGGDRFAGNLVAFPHGLYFGRVEPEEVADLMQGYRAGRIAPLHRYRGRSSDAFHVQTADRAVRDHLGLDRIDDVTRVRDTRRGDRAQVGCDTPLGHVVVHLERTSSAPMRLTCHSSADEAPAGWRVLGIERERGAL